MAKRLTDEKIKSIVAEYLTNGMIKSIALQAVGYSKNYSEHGGLALFDNDRLKDEINRQQAVISQKTGITVSNQQLELIKDRETARKEGKTASAIRCTELLLKTIGGFKADEPNPKTLRAKELDTEKAKALKQAAEWYYSRQYLACKPGENSKEITEVDWTQNEDSVSGPDENQEDHENQSSFSSEKQG